MARAIAADTRIAYVMEVTDGTIPANPPFKILRATGESLEVQRKLVFSGELNGIRGTNNYAMAAKMGAGGFDFEFTDGTLEELLESALRGAWAIDVLVNANTPKPFTVETKFETGGTDIFKRLSGAQVASFTLNASAQEIVTGQMQFMSRKADFANAIVAGAAYAAGNTEPIMTGDRIGSITASGLTFDAVSKISLNLNNNLRGLPVLGSLENIELAAGDLEVTGVLGLYLSDTEFDVLTAFQDATSTSLSFRIGTTAGKITEFSMPNIILEAPKPTAESKEGNVMLELNFRALQATSISGATIQITRNI